MTVFKMPKFKMTVSTLQGLKMAVFKILTSQMPILKMFVQFFAT